MDVIVREAKPEDKDFVLEFTKDTWEHGDYIHLVWDEWLNDPDGLLLVADYKRKPVGILHVRFMPDNSAWLEGLRVHPGYRRRGIAIKLNREAFKKCSEIGIKVFRGAIFEWNTPSLILASTRLGFKILKPKWIVYRGELDKFMKNKECDWKTMGPKMFLQLIKNNKYVSLSRGLVFYQWAWFKLNLDSLNILLRKDKNLYLFKCNSSLFMVKTAEEPRKIVEINIFKDDPRVFKHIKSTLSYILKELDLDKETTIRIAVLDETDVSKEIYSLANKGDSINRLYIFEGSL